MIEERKHDYDRVCQWGSQYLSTFHVTKMQVSWAGMRVGSSRQLEVTSDYRDSSVVQGIHKQNAMGRQPGVGSGERRETSQLRD